MSRYFQVAPPPEDKFAACLYGWLAVVALISTLVLGVLGQYSFAVLFAVGGLIGWWNAGGMTKSYELAWHKANPNPTDQQINEYLSEDIAKAATNAVRRTGIPAHPRPPVAHGPVYDTKKNLPVIVGTRPKRFRAHHVMALCAATDHLYIYQCEVESISGDIRKVELREIYYRDVTLIAVANKSPEVLFLVRQGDGTASGTAEEKIKLTELRICIPGQKPDEITALLTQSSETDAFIAELRSLIRMHKEAVPVGAGVDVSSLAPAVGASIEESLRPMPAAIVEGIRAAMEGPAMQNFDGWVGVEVSADGQPVPLTIDRTVSASSSTQYYITASVSTGELAGARERLIVSRGIDTNPVEFTIEIDSNVPSLRRAPVPVELDPLNGSASRPFHIVLNEEIRGRAWLWVRFGQHGRVLQSIDITLVSDN